MKQLVARESTVQVSKSSFKRHYPDLPDGGGVGLIPSTWGCTLGQQMRMQLCDVNDHLVQKTVLSLARQPKYVNISELVQR